MITFNQREHHQLPINRLANYRGASSYLIVTWKNVYRQLVLVSLIKLYCLQPSEHKKKIQKLTQLAKFLRKCFGVARFPIDASPCKASAGIQGLPAWQGRR